MTELKKDTNLTEKEKKSPTVNTQVVFAIAACNTLSLWNLQDQSFRSYFSFGGLKGDI